MSNLTVGEKNRSRGSTERIKPFKDANGPLGTAGGSTQTGGDESGMFTKISSSTRRNNPGRQRNNSNL